MNVQSQIELLCETLDNKAETAERDSRAARDQLEAAMYTAKAETLREVSDALSLVLLGECRS